MSQPRYSAVLFDLDGTLTDPYEGITRSFIYALQAVGRSIPDEATLRSWIGPPLGETFRTYLGDAALASEAVRFYRQRYHERGMYENRVYPGIPDLLGSLRVSGCRLVLATSKLIGPAQGILAHFGLAPFFDGVAGSTLDERISTKEQVLGEALALLSPAQRADCVMVGDTAYDVIGAHSHGLACIAVSYGYGSLASLRAAEPQLIAHSVAELGALLLHPAA